ncbi:hypothetical protein [Fibrella aquatilis]|uniref:Uncharacterized protein n=1 Tax=Fibrella aquatilis TaxID=2817059 RepID=A0A939K0K9_9BACT|nr:hypothetical protein [Fibrella aquatilis]MBO0934299.1 hypothetical protein [Fibrella aquatilis]
MTKDAFYGILAAVDWNSQGWQGPSTAEDLDNANFNFVKEQDIANSSLNFGHLLFPADESGYYRGFLPHQFAKSPDVEKSRHVSIVFIKSKDWHDGNTYLVGVYAFPVFKKEIIQSPTEAIAHTMETNIKALAKHIHLLPNPINLSAHAEATKFMPNDKKPGKMGYNYMNRINVEKLLDVLTAYNPDDKRLSAIKLNVLRALGNA